MSSFDCVKYRRRRVALFRYGAFAENSANRSMRKGTAMASPYIEHDNMVNVVIRANPFNKEEDSFFGSVTRNTVTQEQLIKGILDENQNTNTGLNAYILNFAMDRMKTQILTEIKNGNAVSVLDLGTMYLCTKGSFKTAKETADVSALKDVQLGVGFTASTDVQNAVDKLKIGSVSHTISTPVINKVINLATKVADGTIKGGKTAEIVGNKLKLMGEPSGVYLVPLDEAQKPTTDETAWIRISDEDILKNYPKSLIVQLPTFEESGALYCVAVRTCFMSGKSDTELKKPVTGFSKPLTVTT